ncbi:uncharacterized protein TRAVEDRAFT_20913 [Trametes versicolor FP-101664 SS1]|uniref:uncharacterized protein n=1 Tax=Trametes versicolor (strain FP-101664) TaxID=717944 RepID=UPI0004623C1D|nr:uncharacterized protein TRAVEDRAFT_20913 [Trametes versicolor FP-101664 SS1]EIW57243.1 hypothetical protein TRAVEDRAFT_20913 [Trametes versicolor FP-101664 SS1]
MGKGSLGSPPRQYRRRPSVQQRPSSILFRPLPLVLQHDRGNDDLLTFGEHRWYTDASNQNTGFSQSAVNKPAGGDALVKSEFPMIYTFPNDEHFYAAVDTYLVDTTWVRLESWENNGDDSQRYTYQYKTELKITQGADVTTCLNLGARFKDLALGVDGATKTFSADETTSSQTKGLLVDVHSRKKITLYQRRYTFRCDMHFVLDAWREYWNAGAASGDGIARKECTVQIMSGDYLVAEKELSDAAVGTLQVKAVSRSPHNNESNNKTRKRENLTNRAKRALSQMGV